MAGSSPQFLVEGDEPRGGSIGATRELPQPAEPYLHLTKKVVNEVSLGTTVTMRALVPYQQLSASSSKDTW